MSEYLQFQTINVRLLMVVKNSLIPCFVLDILMLVLGIVVKEIQVVHLFVIIEAKLSLLVWSAGVLYALILIFLGYMPELLQP